MDAIDEENSVQLREDGSTDGTEVNPGGSNSLRAVVRPAPLEILQHVRFNEGKETPRSTIKGILNLSNQKELKFSGDNLRKAEEQLKRAFIEFYHKLRLLKSYR